MTKEEFMAVTGFEPEQDDLERANCPKAGQLGHKACGVCEHGMPTWTCKDCFPKAVRNGN